MKIPKVFVPSLSLRDFERTILRRVHLKKERQFIQQLYGYPAADERPKKLTKKVPGPLLSRAEDLDKPTLDHLRALAKDIKANKGLFSPVKLGIIVLLLGSASVFALVFQNRVFQGIFESNLSQIAGTPAVFDGFRIRLFNTGVWFDRLQIGDAEDPSLNSVDLRGVAIDMETDLLLKGQFRIRSFGAELLAFGTPRQVDPARDQAIRQALIESGRVGSSNQAETEEGGLAGALSQWFAPDAGAVLGAITGASDLESLGQQEIANLTTPAVIRDQIASTQQILQRLQDAASNLPADLQNLEQEVRALETQWTRAQGSVPEAITLGTQAAATVTEAQGLVIKTQGLVTDSQTFTRDFTSTLATIDDQIAQDFLYLENRAQELVSVTLDNPIESLVLPMLSTRALSFLPQIYQAQALWNRVKESMASGKASSDTSERQGREVNLDPQTHPRFLLDRAFLTLQLPGQERRFSAEARSLSSHPHRVAEPGIVEFTYDQPGQNFALQTQIIPSNDDLIIDTSGIYQEANASITLPAGFISARALEGQARYEGRLVFLPNGQVDLSGQIRFTNQRFILDGQPSLISSRIIQALEGLTVLDLGITAGPQGLSLTSNAGPALEREAQALVQEQIAQLTQVMTDEANRILEPYIAELEGLEQEVRQIESQIKAYSQQSSSVEVRIQELQDELTHAAREIIPIPNVLVPNVQVPSIPIPSVPSLPSLPSLPGRR
ncbi:MAG: hypothetical protein GW949_10295 [Spirochaetales bacterium]|nr:hypothetical protein [Spirochaetales bacterium]